MMLTRGNLSSSEQRKYAIKIMPVRKNGHLLLVTLLLCNMIVNESLPVIADPVLGGGVQGVVVATALIVMWVSNLLTCRLEMELHWCYDITHRHNPSTNMTNKTFLVSPKSFRNLCSLAMVYTSVPNWLDSRNSSFILSCVVCCSPVQTVLTLQRASFRGLSQNSSSSSLARTMASSIGGQS